MISKKQNKKFSDQTSIFRQTASKGHDTVGAVAIDRDGSTAFATSTGGITAKYPGRVGDSPIIGIHQ